MATVHYFLSEDAQLSEEEIKEIEAAKNRPIVYDEDCPSLTPEQLARFRPAKDPKPGLIKLIIET